MAGGLFRAEKRQANQLEFLAEQTEHLSVFVHGVSEQQHLDMCRLMTLRELKVRSLHARCSHRQNCTRVLLWYGVQEHDVIPLIGIGTVLKAIL